MAARNGHLRVVRLLLKAGANPNAQGNLGKTALIASAARGDGQAVNSLLSASADVGIIDNYGMSALSWACRNGHLGVAKLLLLRRADPLLRGATNKYSLEPGESALSWALKERRHSLVRWLLGADLGFPKHELLAARQYLQEEATSAAGKSK